MSVLLLRGNKAAVELRYSKNFGLERWFAVKWGGRGREI